MPLTAAWVHVSGDVLPSLSGLALWLHSWFTKSFRDMASRLLITLSCTGTIHYFVVFRIKIMEGAVNCFDNFCSKFVNMFVTFNSFCFFFFRHKYLSMENVRTVYPMVRFICKRVCLRCEFACIRSSVSPSHFIHSYKSL